MNQKSKYDYSARENNVKLPFWPSKELMIWTVCALLGFVIGAVGGPVLMYLGLMFLGLFIPIYYGLFSFIILFGLSVPLGAAAGTAIGMAIAERMKREPKSSDGDSSS